MGGLGGGCPCGSFTRLLLATAIEAAEDARAKVAERDALPKHARAAHRNLETATVAVKAAAADQERAERRLADAQAHQLACLDRLHTILRKHPPTKKPNAWKVHAFRANSWTHFVRGIVRQKTT